jgi:hypothetical protein
MAVKEMGERKKDDINKDQPSVKNHAIWHVGAEFEMT